MNLDLSANVLFVGSARTDSVRFRRGFEEGRLKDKIALLEAIFSSKSPIPYASWGPKFLETPQNTDN